jgi:hypothetical protein
MCPVPNRPYFHVYMDFVEDGLAELKAAEALLRKMARS